MIKIDGTGGNLTLHNQNVENYQQSSEEIMPENLEDISNDASIANIVAKGEGSIVFSDLKVDLRRLLFGSFPIIKKITPGGPLVLEPFTVTMTGSFNREDMMESLLLDDGLRRLVARALKRRVRSLRDLLDGAVFYGRSWNMASKQAPVVEVPKLTNIEFDNKKNKLIITGKAKIRASPDQPFVEQSFKLRTKLGTREGGQYIRLEEPELALVLECPKAWERNIVSACKNLELPVPKRPEPLYQFIPLVSPIKKTEQDGFNLGEDNRIKSIYVQDDALRFEISAVLRPGRFLGNHYIAFTIPNRTFIITMDRIKEGMKNARMNKLERERSERERKKMEAKDASDRYNKAFAQAISSSDVSVNNYAADLSNGNIIDEEFSFLDPDSGDTVPAFTEEVAVGNRPGFFRSLSGRISGSCQRRNRD